MTDDTEFISQLGKYRDKLITLLHKSQDSFEKQLTYISAGSLALSMGFIKDIVKDMNCASAKWMLNAAWILLATTLLINCFSHFVAANLHNKTIAEINHSKYNPGLITKRSCVIVA